MSKQVYRVVISTAWWWNWLYLPGVMTLAILGATPDWDKVALTCQRAIRVRLKHVDNSELDA